MSKNQSKKTPDQAKKPEGKTFENDRKAAAEVVEPETVEAEATADDLDETARLIESLQQELAESKNSLLRAYADTDNTRKRLLKETEQAKKYRFQSAALELLPILDNLNRALAAKPDNPEIENFVKGFEMIQQQFVTALTNEGVAEIEAEGKPFDPNFMQALQTEKKEGVEPGIVTEVFQKGYKLKDRILRPALVKVSE
ncbi:nucleotide exchange factor GrpE [Allobaculum mucilyticum]|uniref:nucleotide exchange factor GrpE n=1 Tax=Allobaculum mucilyticum TaxID=2834459 RepID=UPI001E2E901E|nr:nucleotide exchange factor GrpE [Allobaculum mucilyticum]UNT97237.1 nucleotide exchange factor GrpE [Allobaculum mucilyticum]